MSTTTTTGVTPQGQGAARSLPRTRVLPVHSIVHEAKLRVKRIFDHREQLADILKDHGRSFEKRWTNKDRQSRVNILKQVYPKIPAKSLLNPKQATLNSQDTGNAFRQACLWPPLNISDLITDDIALESTYHQA